MPTSHRLAGPLTLRVHRGGSYTNTDDRHTTVLLVCHRTVSRAQTTCCPPILLVRVLRTRSMALWLEVAAACRQFDVGHKGYITARELKYVFVSCMGYKPTKVSDKRCSRGCDAGGGRSGQRQDPAKMRPFDELTRAATDGKLHFNSWRSITC